jgi:hypothetical protein
MMLAFTLSSGDEFLSVIRSRRHSYQFLKTASLISRGASGTDSRFGVIDDENARIGR